VFGRTAAVLVALADRGDWLPKIGLDWRPNRFCTELTASEIDTFTRAMLRMRRGLFDNRIAALPREDAPLSLPTQLQRQFARQFINYWRKV